jgi:hypothetical protein
MEVVMPIILVTTAFPFSVDGNEVVQIEVGEQEVSDRCALVAVEHLGVATLLDDDGGEETDPLKMKIDDLRAWLTVKGIAFDPAAKKPDLQALVPSND